MKHALYVDVANAVVICKRIHRLCDGSMTIRAIPEEEAMQLRERARAAGKLMPQRHVDCTTMRLVCFLVHQGDSWKAVIWQPSRLKA